MTHDIFSRTFSFGLCQQPQCKIWDTILGYLQFLAWDNNPIKINTFLVKQELLGDAFDVFVFVSVYRVARAFT